MLVCGLLIVTFFCALDRSVTRRPVEFTFLLSVQEKYATLLTGENSRGQTDVQIMLRKPT